MPVELPKPSRTKASRFDDMPRLVRFLAVHLIFGLALGVAFGALILISNISGIKTLIAESSNPYLAFALLLGMNALTFGSLSMGIGVMTLPLDSVCDMRDPEDRDDNERGSAGQNAHEGDDPTRR